MKILSILLKCPEKQKLNFSHSVLFHMKSRVCLKFFANDCRDFDTSNLSAKTDFLALKLKLTSYTLILSLMLIGFNNLKTRVDDLHVDKLKTILIDFKKLNDAVSKKVVKKDSGQQTKHEST